jgi:PKD domain/Phosphoesterase family
MIIGVVAMALPALPNVHAAAGTNFDNIVIIAMENTGYQDVIGSSSQAPFINNQLVPVSANLAHYLGYGAAGRSVNGCSAGCYTALIGADNSISDGYSCCLPGPTITDRMATAGLTWQAYCESGCPRGNDHFPFTGFATTSTSANIFPSSSVSTADFVTATNSANPPNLLWYTPTDGHNMHDNSVSSGDTYVQNFLVGSGTVSSPSSGSLLASSLFTSGKRVLLLLWWDECGASNGGSGCNSNGDTPNVWYGPHAGIIAGLASQVNNLYDEYSILHLIENNWAIPTINSIDDAAAPMIDIFGASNPSGLTTSFTVSPSIPVVNSPVTFTATTQGGMGPYTVTWDFGDGSTATGGSVSHKFAGVQSYTVTETVQDSSTPPKTSTSSQTVSNKAASGGSGGGSGGSGGGSGGSCLLCGTFPSLSTSMWLLAIGGLLGLVGSLVLLTIRARANLARTKRRMNHVHH